ncbi:hypothetical protein SBI_03832 [Streptomyces bingchenggensis BCW-1]|uniref:Uncharacterized protein n=1 Tax=Streptomyces bingchenggensis (strain BCW-1) TaxID=749414 RepID=D7CG45_STRBB|nr:MULTISPECIES: hypothetical protein [Streptomyces]ADI06953.1 hypothetical protein SBI_03832 [Streptomyces bingchenggensis BCW-1]
MNAIDVDDDTYRKLVFAARMMGCTPSEVVRRLVDASSTEIGTAAAKSSEDPHSVPVHALYRGRRVEATFDRNTRAVTIKDGPHAGTTYPTPSAAASAVVQVLNPDRNPNTNGWNFWRLNSSGDELKALRRSV